MTLGRHQRSTRSHARSGVRDMQVATVDDVVKALRDGALTVSKHHHSINSAVDERRKSGNIAADLTEDYIADRIQAEARQRLHREVVAVAAKPGDTDDFAFKVLRSPDFRPCDDVVRELVLEAADEDQIVRALSEGAHNAYRSSQSDFNVTTEESRGGHARGGDVDQFNVQVVLAKQSGVLRNPGHRIRYRLSGIEQAELVGRCGPA